MPAGSAIRSSARVRTFTYAIRNIVAEAKKVEASGRTVRYLNIGDPIPFGFKTPPHLVEAVSRAMRDGHNGYAASAGIVSAREAVAAEYQSRGVPVSADRVILTSGTSEGIELALGALADSGDEVLVPTPTYPLYTAVLAKIGARAVYYRTDPARGWLPDVDDIRRRIGPATRALVLIDPNNPTGAVYPEATRRALVELATRAGVPILADEVYSDLAFDGRGPLLGSLDPDAPILSFSSLSKAYLAPGWRAGWLVTGRSPGLDDVLGAIRKLADARLCSPGPMQYGIEAALTGDRSHQKEFVRELVLRATLTTRRLESMPGMRVVAPRAAFYAMPQVALPPGATDEDFVLGLLRATGILCVYGSGFGLPADQGFFRIVFLASPDELGAIYDDLAAYAGDFARQGAEDQATPVISADEQRQRRLIVRAVVVSLTGIAVLWLIVALSRVLLLLYVAGLLAVGLSPIVRLIERRRLMGQRRRRVPRWAAILVLYVGILVTFAGVLSILLPPIVEQSRALWANLPDLADRGQALLRGWGLSSGQWSWADFARRLPSPELALTGIFSALQSILGLVGALVTVFILPYYLLIEADDLHATFIRLFDEERRPQVSRITAAVTEKVGAWLGGQLLLALVIGSTAALGLKLLGVPYFWVLALVAAIGEMIPVVGPILAAIPSILVGFTVSPQTGMVVAAYFSLQQFIENNFLVPRIMERQVGVSAITVMAALLVGTELLGLVGALLAVPTAAIIQVLFQEFMKKDDASPAST